MQSALIVAHGQPSDPEPAGLELALLASKVAAELPGWQVGSATLAEAGALDAALSDTGPGVLVYPMFMAGGWFTTENLPMRLRASGARDAQVLPAFGVDPAVQALCVQIAREAAAAGGIAFEALEILLAAHGSGRSQSPALVARQMARLLRDAGCARAEAYFIDQTPKIADAPEFGPTAFCLPFFAARGGHVVDDLPAALAQSGFAGPVLPPLGLDARVPGLIADALRHRVRPDQISPPASR